MTQTFPLLEDKVRHVEELSRRAPPIGANMTESIRNKKDVIEKTRNLVNRVIIFRSGSQVNPEFCIWSFNQRSKV